MKKSKADEIITGMSHAELNLVYKNLRNSWLNQVIFKKYVL